MPFKNKIRLPIQILRPQFPEERTTYRKANGVTKTLSVVVRKSYEGETDWLPESWHERLKMALAHDDVNLEGDKYLGGISQDGDYDIEWQDFLDYPTAKAKFKVQVTPFAATNNNCMTCEEAQQLDLTDDSVQNAYDEDIDMQEETEYVINVAENDEICCYPAVFSIVSFNTYYLDSAEITQEGILTVVTKADLVAANHILLATYRVTCPNGQYDDANLYGNIDGTIVGCLAPLNVELTSVTSSTAAVSWDDPTPLPANGYIWELYLASAPGTPVATGTEPTGGVFPALTGLDDGEDYIFYVKSDCDGSESEFIELEFSTLTESEVCGRYLVGYDDGSGLRGESGNITYLDCNSVYQTVVVFNMTQRSICTLQNSPGDPVDIVGATTITYMEEC